MKLTIRTLFVVEAEPSETIRDLKLRISEQGFPVDGQNLLCTGKSLQDDKTIDSCGIKDASTLILMIKAPPAGITPSASKNSSPRIEPGTLGEPPAVPTASGSSISSMVAKVSMSAVSAVAVLALSLLRLSLLLFKLLLFLPRWLSHLTVLSPAYAAPPSAPPVASSSSMGGISEATQGPAVNGAGIFSNVPVEPSQSNINNIMSMGFTKDQAVRALRASFDDLDQAIELLLYVFT